MDFKGLLAPFLEFPIFRTSEWARIAWAPSTRLAAVLLLVMETIFEKCGSAIPMSAAPSLSRGPILFALTQPGDRARCDRNLALPRDRLHPGEHARVRRRLGRGRRRLRLLGQRPRNLQSRQDGRGALRAAVGSVQRSVLAAMISER
jgi:hypothetical protein